MTICSIKPLVKVEQWLLQEFVEVQVELLSRRLGSQEQELEALGHYNYQKEGFVPSLRHCWPRLELEIQPQGLRQGFTE
jgi:hypothetical protein